MLNEPFAKAVAEQSFASPPLHSTTLWQEECSLMTCTPEIENAPVAVHHKAPTGPGAHWSHGPKCIGFNTEAVRGWCQATQPPDLAYHSIQICAGAQGRPSGSCVLHTNLSFPQNIPKYQWEGCHCPAKLPTAQLCCGSQARQQHMTVRLPLAHTCHVQQLADNETTP